MAGTGTSTITIPRGEVTCNPWGAISTFAVYETRTGDDHFYGHIEVTQNSDRQVTAVTYNPWATIFCVGSFAATITESKRGITLTGQKEAPCGCPTQPIPGVGTINPACFIPSDFNWDPVARHPHEFRLSTSTWRGDTGYALLGVEDDVLVHDMTQAAQGTPGYSGTRAYLASGAGLGELYGQWQIDVKLAHNYGSNVLPAAFEPTQPTSGDTP